MKNDKCVHKYADLFIIMQLNSKKVKVGCECGAEFIYKISQLPKDLKEQLNV